MHQTSNRVVKGAPSTSNEVHRKAYRVDDGGLDEIADAPRNSRTPSDGVSWQIRLTGMVSGEGDNFSREVEIF